jgi:exopolysaccharide biosynthesis polyprenyl glycosylphosphotransferase
VIDQVLIAPSPSQLDRVNRLLARCREDGVMAGVVLSFLASGGNQVTLDRFDGTPLLTYSTAPADEVLLGIRRVLDVLLASAVLLLLSPLMLVVALAIKLTAPSAPVFYRQLRAGLRGRRFEVVKFRSMVPGADTLKPALEPYNEMDGPAFKMSNDPRVTALGAFLRRTSIDELPQLWNVLRGDMSFVGPRPVPVEEADRYEPWQRRRLSMKPGLTCLWQVSGRNELSFDEWMRLDLDYIDRWSLWLDAKILLKTIPAVLSGRGAR